MKLEHKKYKSYFDLNKTDNKVKTLENKTKKTYYEIRRDELLKTE